MFDGVAHPIPGMSKLLLDARTLSILKNTTRYLAEQQERAYLVGGSLRNILLGEPCNDWDIVIEGDAHRLSRRLADKLGGHYAHLHDKASRVIIKNDPEDITLDIASLNGKTIEEDLRTRDFTINAIAVPLNSVVYNSPVIIDPLHGAEDLQARRLRAIDGSVFQHDPLRMLRAVRLISHYQFDLDPWTRELIKQDAARLLSVAAERIHDELYAILESDGATGRLRLLDDLGLLTILIPEFIPARGMRQPSPHYWDVFEHSLETVGALEQIARTFVGRRFILSNTSGVVDAINRLPTPENTPIYLTSDAPTSASLSEIQNMLKEAEQQGIFSPAELTAPRMKMAALLHDIGKPVTFTTGEDGSIRFYNHPQVGSPIALQIMRRLCASTRDRRLAQLVAAHHMRPGQLGQDSIVTTRAIRRFFVDLGPTGIAVALFSLADHLATLGPQPLSHSWERHLSVVNLLLTRYIRERESILPPRLLSPEELMRRLKLEPGPLVGQLLEAIAEAQSEGIIHSKEEALWFAEERLQN
ncbi:MAG TPA: HD domain-containing protein [Ktedonobacteraceae bacterium]|nr:HD domain-containing protein [Ktedonobacteraceae bacterium]